MINLQDKSDKELRVFYDKVQNNLLPSGTRFIYHVGDSADEIGSTLLGKMARMMAGSKWVKQEVTREVEYNGETVSVKGKEYVETYDRALDKVILVQRRVGDNFEYIGVVR